MKLRRTNRLTEVTGDVQFYINIKRGDSVTVAVLLLKTRSVKTSNESGFVADGCERARAAIEPQVRADVEREYAGRIANASIIQRWRLKREIDRLIAERIARIAPPDALY